MTTNVTTDEAYARLDRFVRKQQARCFSEHRYRASLLRIHPRDYELLMLARAYIAVWDNRTERYNGMEMVIDEQSGDGPVVECDAFWQHGRETPRGYVPSR